MLELGRLDLMLVNAGDSDLKHQKFVKRGFFFYQFSHRAFYVYDDVYL